MMNKKGMTIIEIVVSITLVSVILVFLINLLITVKGNNDANANRSDLLINQALLTKEIQKDFIDYHLTGVTSCSSSDISQSGRERIIPEGASNVYCLKLTYDETLIDNNVGYLLQYSYPTGDNTTKNVVGYKRGSNQIIRESNVSMNPSSNKGMIKTSCKNNYNDNCSLKITMPIIDDNDNNYSLDLVYIYQKDNFTYGPFTNHDPYGFEEL